MKKENVKNALYELLENQLSNDLTYHNLRHTQDVVSVCLFYIDHYEIGAEDAELLEIAAAGHDVGFTKTYANHEAVSAQITRDIMKQFKYDNSAIEKVSELIHATRIPQSPQNFLEQIICDADLDYLGRDDFEEIGLTLKDEWVNYDIVPNLSEEFDNIQIGFLKNHFFHTDYAVEHRSPVKLQHLRKLELDRKQKINCLQS